MVQAIACISRQMRIFVALSVVGVAVLVSAGAAHAEWYFTKSGAQKAAKDYVSKHYADTYVSDLTDVCTTYPRRYDPRYKYHRWTCAWHDSRDGTSGVVLIVGSSRRGGYYGRVLRGAH